MSVDHELQSEEADAVYLDDDAVVVDVDDQGNFFRTAEISMRVTFWNW